MHVSLPPTPEQERDLHARLLEDDPTAPADLLAAYLSPLTQWLELHNDSGISFDFFELAASDALVDLIKNPAKFDPQKSSLFGFLKLVAQRDFLNLWKKEQRHHRHRAEWNDVEQSLPDGNNTEEDVPENAVIDAREIFEAVHSGLTEREANAMKLLVEGERRTEAFARVLGLEHLSAAEQRREVKRMKDKLKKRIERTRREHDATPQ